MIPSPSLVGTSARTTLLGVARHSLPTIVEATLIPTALFYVAWLAIGTWAAYGVALAWAGGALVRRLHNGERVPGILVLALIGLGVRTALAVATGSTFLYFAQPIMGTSLVAILFLVSALTSRPFVARLAGDFYPLTPDIAGRRGIQRLFRNLTLLWAGVQLLNAGAGASLLVTLPTAAFIPTKTVVALMITAAGVVVTVLTSLRVARHEGLVTTPAAA
ncbi:MAG TPA: VC0807 family protein [Mycobacteriales bacterium]|nr:VC0807 family protein [Mycobacteriales bacterium]